MSVPFPIPLLTCGNTGNMPKVLGNKFEIGNQHNADTLEILACTRICEVHIFHKCLPSPPLCWFSTFHSGALAALGGFNQLPGGF